MRDHIRRDFEAMFPAWAGVETPHFWSGLLNLSRGLTPYVGPVPDLPGAFVAMAYHGNGVAMASYSGALVADLVRDKPAHLPFPTVMQAPLGRFPLGRFRRVLLDASYRIFALRDAL
jgi:glycine/D-amino acid oxidase-like deaminating enzyme